MPIPRQVKAKELLQAWIDAIIEENSDSLSDWESNFMDSVQIQLNNYGYLSFKQEDVLERIYAEKTK